ncbi:MAG: thioredoxin domain-containing protein [Ignavibacterium sp.]
MKERKPNNLINEKSPYLLQHAYNPVDWYPWCDEAFEKAAKENKPIFLSIGYSTCHWCHVMEKESFEDEEVAELMNDTFISIKVDREERPDIDNLYMTVCQILTGNGGWPLTILMTPDKKPFFAGTYIPKYSAYGRNGLIELTKTVKEIWNNSQEDVLNSAEKISSTLLQSFKTDFNLKISDEILDIAFNQLKEKFDNEYGGFGNAPKFPTAHYFTFLLRYYYDTNNEFALNMVTKTLNEISKGGIFDHIGFGFHRYSTDKKWLVPHFEKMLYDQALLAIAFSETYQVTKNDYNKEKVYQIFNYVKRNLTSDEGAFYSAEDADSEGEEGKFYLWTIEEVQKILKEDSDLIIEIFNLKPEGNFLSEVKKDIDGKNIFYLTKSLEEIANEKLIPYNELKLKVNTSIEKLYNARERRIHPNKDDKILTDWNALMIAAYAKAYQTFGEEEFLNSAEKGMDFILNNLKTKEGFLFHRYRNNEVSINGFLDDYAFLIYALIELYEASFKIEYLEQALRLNEILIEHFWDEKFGGFYFTSDFSEELLVRQKEIYDGAIPSGNSITMLNLLKLFHYTENFDLQDKALSIAKAFYNQYANMPMFYPQLLNAIYFYLHSPSEIIIIGEPNNNDTKEMLTTLQKNFIPNKILIYKNPFDNNEKLNEIIPFIKDYKMIDEKATAYVCKNFSCQLPTTDLNKLLALIN